MQKIGKVIYTRKLSYNKETLICQRRKVKIFLIKWKKIEKREKECGKTYRQPSLPWGQEGRQGCSSLRVSFPPGRWRWSGMRVEIDPPVFIVKIDVVNCSINHLEKTNLKSFSWIGFEGFISIESSPFSI